MIFRTKVCVIRGAQRVLYALDIPLFPVDVLTVLRGSPRTQMLTVLGGGGGGSTQEDINSPDVPGTPRMPGRAGSMPGPGSSGILPLPSCRIRCELSLQASGDCLENKNVVSIILRV